jgi:hypothetical protein
MCTGELTGFDSNHHSPSVAPVGSPGRRSPANHYCQWKGCMEKEVQKPNDQFLPNPVIVLRRIWDIEFHCFLGK